ncbi:uncharacterized protein LOC120339628 [Styela clava]
MSKKQMNLEPSAPTEQELYSGMVDDVGYYQDSPPPYTEVQPNSHLAAEMNGATSLSADAQNMMLEPARNLIQNSKFHEAASLLEKLPLSTTQQLMLAECYIRLHRNMNATKRIIELETMLTSSHRPKLSDVNKVINSYIDNSQYIRALILILCSANLYKIELSPDVAIVRFHRERAVKVYDIIISMKKKGKEMHAIAKDFGVEILLELFSVVQRFRDIEPTLKFNQEAYCISLIAAMYGAIEEYKEEIDYCNIGINFMKKKFGEGAQKYRVYGHFWNNKAIAYGLEGNHIESEKSYVVALECYRKVQDWTSDEQEKKFIGGVESRLRSERDQIMKMNK